MTAKYRGVSAAASPSVEMTCLGAGLGCWVFGAGCLGFVCRGFVGVGIADFFAAPGSLRGGVTGRSGISTWVRCL
jgi:hypothetical protein